MNICEKKHCTGCGACMQICPVNAISMHTNEEGFFFPQIDESKCINCNLCKKSCPHNIEKEYSYMNVYAAKIKDMNAIMKSSSGGLFYAFAKYVLDLDGYVYGCSWDDNLRAHHIEVCDEKDLHLIQGSKYVQSDTENTYSLAKMRLEQGHYVLYCGTPCQIAGLKAFLKKEYDRLYTVDFVCHGVPSPLLFERYIESLRKKYNGTINNYNFREKIKYGWGLYPAFTVEKNGMEKRIYKKNGKTDKYYYHFVSGNTYRDSCYNCEYARKERISDITLGDCWGVKEFCEAFYDKKGVSVCLVNNSIGEELFQKIEKSIECVEIDLKQVIKHNANLDMPMKRSRIRDNIYYGIDTDTNYIKNKLKLPVVAKLKALVPGKMKSSLKKIIRS